MNPNHKAMEIDNILANKRVILFYNGVISALTLFVQHADDSICTPAALPSLSEALPEGEIDQLAVNVHPAAIVRAVNKLMGLPENLLKAEPGFSEQIDTPQGIVTVYLARFDLLDPPHEMMANKGNTLKTLTELRERPPAEMELLRRAYTLIMES